MCVLSKSQIAAYILLILIALNVYKQLSINDVHIGLDYRQMDASVWSDAKYIPICNRTES